MSKAKQSDDDTVEAARSFLQQFAGLQRLASMVDEVSSLREELEALTVERDRAKHELSVLWGERDGELQKLTEQIETGLKAKYDEAERVVSREAEARKSLANLSEELQDRRRKLTSLEAQIMRAEGQYGAINEKLSQLRGSIAVGA